MVQENKKVMLLFIQNTFDLC